MTLQIDPNPLKDPNLPGRFARLIIKHMIRLSLSDDQLLHRLRGVDGGTRGSLASIRRHKDGTGGQPTTQTIGTYQKALGIPDAQIDAMLYPDDPSKPGQPGARVFRDQFEELAEELKRQSNLPFEVQRNRAEAKAALADDDFERARACLTSAAGETRRIAEHASEEYARSLAALGALAFTVLNYAEARIQYGLAMHLPGLSGERTKRYQRSYLIASNAVIAHSADLLEGRKVLDEMVAAGVKPNEVTYNTLINLAPDYAGGRKLLDEMVAAGVKPNEVTYSTLINLAPDYAGGRNVLDEMVAAGVKPDEVTMSTLAAEGSFEEGCDLARDARDGREWYTGRGFYEALFSRQIVHLDADDLLEIYKSLPFQFETALQNPIRQYRRDGRPDEAMALCLFAPHLSAAQKFYRESYAFCHAYLKDREATLNDVDNFHYCFGIAAHANGDWDLARKYLSVARDRAYARPRIDHIERMLRSIP